MLKQIRIILTIFVLFAVFTGFKQLSSNTDVFAKVMLPCCNNGLCHDSDCTMSSSILPCVGNEYIADCRTCMEEIIILYNCDKYLGPLPTWCNESDGSKFYATNPPSCYQCHGG